AIAANQARQKEFVAKKTAQIAAKKSELSAKRSADVLAVIVDSFASANPELGGKANIPARVILDEITANVETSDLDDQGKVEIYRTLFETFQGLGLYEPAIESAEKELAIRKTIQGLDARDTLTAEHNLAMVYRKTGKIDQAITLHERVLDDRKRLFGPLDPDVLTSMNNLAMAYHFGKRRDEALSLQEETLYFRRMVLGEEHLDTILSMNNLGVFVKRMGQLERAESLLSKAWELRKNILGPENPFTLSAANNLANVYTNVGKFHQALSLQKQVLTAREKIEGKTHPRTLTAKANLAGTYLRLENPSASIPLLEEVIRDGQKNVRGSAAAVDLHDLIRAYSYFELENHPDKIANLMTGIGDFPPFTKETWRNDDLEIRKSIHQIRINPPTEDDFQSAYDSLSTAFDRLVENQESNEHPKSAVPLKRLIFQTATWLLRISKELEQEQAIQLWESKLDQIEPVPSGPKILIDSD
ncbi:MAG: tetratricopeptide repeat protein, partial [Planctomycetota bacterium]